MTAGLIIGKHREQSKRNESCHAKTIFKIYIAGIHTPGYPMPLPIVRLVLICKVMDFAHKQISIALQIKTSLTMGNGIGYPIQCIPKGKLAVYPLHRP